MKTYRDYGWLAVAIFFTVGFVVSVIDAVDKAVSQKVYAGLVFLPLGAIVAWWLIAGSWRRTCWGRGREVLR